MMSRSVNVTCPPNVGYVYRQGVFNKISIMIMEGITIPHEKAIAKEKKDFFVA